MAKKIDAPFQNLPLSFEANRGQFDKRARFLVRGQDRSLFLTDYGMVVVLADGRASEPVQAVVRMQFQGRVKTSRPEGVDPLPGITNYFSGGRHITDIPNFARVEQKQAYRGIDVVYYGSQGQLEYDFVVAPGADAGRIRIRLSGHDSAHISESGDLVLATSAGDVVMKKPFAYQERDGERMKVPVQYVLGTDEIGFHLGAYDPVRALIIDPILSFSSFLGGSADDFAYAIARDPAGNIYLAGETSSTDFPVAGAFQTKKQGSPDAFVTKLNPAGSSLVYSTYLGGRNGSTSGRGIAVDASGSAYVTGWTSSSAYPVTSGAYSTSHTSGTLAGFVSKLSPQGNALAYSTFVPGGQGAAIAVDASGGAFVTGAADAIFSTTPGSFQPGGGGGIDAYVLKLGATGTTAIYATRLGGSLEDRGNGVAIDAQGNAYVAGFTASSDFPVASALQPFRQGVNDGFVAKLNATGEALAYSTYLGGSLTNRRESANAIAVDAAGHAYVTGTTHSLDFPVVRAFQFSKAYTGQGHDAISHAFVTKLTPTGEGLVYSSYFGGTSCLGSGEPSCIPAGEDETGAAIAIDAAGIAYFAGRLRSRVVSQVDAIHPLANEYGTSLPYVARVQDRGSAVQLYTVALGVRNGAKDEGGASGIAVDDSGSAYVSGYVVNGFPTTPGALKVVTDFPCCLTRSVVFKLSPGEFPTTLSVSNSAPTSAQSVTLTATVTSAVPQGQVTFLQNGNSLATVGVSQGTASFTTTLPAGVHELSAVYSGDNKASRPVFLPVRQATN